MTVKIVEYNHKGDFHCFIYWNCKKFKFKRTCLAKSLNMLFDRTKYKSDLKDLKDAVNELTKEIQEMKK